MPGLVILFILGVGSWAWWTGRLKGFSYEDAAASVLFLLGLRLLTTGKLLPGALLMSGALFYAAWRRGQKLSASMGPAQARLILGVNENASLGEIRDAHRRLITSAHPDMGGSEERAKRINAARDCLVSELNRN